MLFSTTVAPFYIPTSNAGPNFKGSNYSTFWPIFPMSMKEGGVLKNGNGISCPSRQQRPGLVMVSDRSNHTQSDAIILLGVCLSPSPRNRLILQLLESSPGSLLKLPGSWWLRCAGFQWLAVRQGGQGQGALTCRRLASHLNTMPRVCDPNSLHHVGQGSSQRQHGHGRSLSMQ